jgi:transcriptional regulator with XRE-family HTH domain
MNNRTCNAKDLYIAKKLRERRIEMGLQQRDLAAVLKVTSQQIHKYERGIDRVPASRLDDLSTLLSVPLTFFYEAIEDKALSTEFVINCTHLQTRKKVSLKFFQFKATLTDMDTQEDYEIEIF